MNYRKESSHDQKLDLKLNLSPPRENIFPISPSRSSSYSSLERSPASSCISGEPTPDDHQQFFGSPETTTSMMLVGCPRCLMYVMLPVEDPKCPKCKSSVLLDFFREDRIKNSKK
ncbi:protein GL2-INTERACTING REPRESSOR 1-like [Lycium barbarum]|uniref:protein GL2-INTERACTING REPRESSOR 1-like n=1 Tax=Lycium barbarum TaxID=112863 RepID=UPI00293F2516|nr:protein GL2-INTERACTING REPRESSOR 1-like [Lycium barbarum]